MNFPAIDTLTQIPNFHENYARALLNLIVAQWDEDEPLVATYFPEKGDALAALAYEDTFGMAQLNLFYDGEFIIELSDEEELSKFIYKITEDSRLNEIIPQSLRNAMEGCYDSIVDNEEDLNQLKKKLGHSDE